MKLQIQCEEGIEPKCPHFGLCGGCRFQHIPYSDQLSQKENFVSSLFDKRVERIIASESPWRYRNKMEFSFAKKWLGLMKRGKNQVVTIEECWLTQPWFMEVLKNVREWWMDSGIPAYNPPTNTGALRTLTLREGTHSKERMAVLTVSEDIPLEGFIEAVGEIDSLILRKQITAKGIPTRFEETLLRGKDHICEWLHDEAGHPWKFKIRAASFFQPNTLQAELLYQKAIELAEIREDEHVFDLYCGTGSLGLFASRKAKTSLGIELVPEAVMDARENISLNNVKNMEVLEGDVGKILKTVSANPDTVIVDPPRVGLSAQAIETLLSFKPKKILYISCNPASQAENCKEFVAGGYTIDRLQPVDQFPHTPHVENIALLTRF